MSYHQPLEKLIGTDRTLVVACQECHATAFYTDTIITLLTHSNSIHTHNYDLRHEIHTLIDSFECTRMVIMGHSDCRLLFEPMPPRENPDYTFSLMPVQEMLTNVEEDRRAGLLTQAHAMQLCIELHVIEQVKTVMGYSFVNEKVSHGTLAVSGVIYHPSTHTVQELIRNEWNYNSVKALN